MLYKNRLLTDAVREILHSKKRFISLLVMNFLAVGFLAGLRMTAPDMKHSLDVYFDDQNLMDLRIVSTLGLTQDDLEAVLSEDFGAEAVGTRLPEHDDPGFELLQGAPVFSGPILGGCIDSLYEILVAERYADEPAVCAQYGLFPSLDDWTGKLLLLESSEEKAPPEKYRRMVRALKQTGVFRVVSGVLMGKPENETYFAEYKKILLEEIARPDLPVMTNISVGHALPRCIIPLGVNAVADAEKQEITFLTNQ